MSDGIGDMYRQEEYNKRNAGKIVIEEMKKKKVAEQLAKGFGVDKVLDNVVEQLSKGFGAVEQPKPQYPIHTYNSDAGCNGGDLPEIDNVQTHNFDYESILKFIPRSNRERNVSDLMQIGLVMYKTNRANFADMEELGAFAELKGTGVSKMKKFYNAVDNINYKRD